MMILMIKDLCYQSFLHSISLYKWRNILRTGPHRSKLAAACPLSLECTHRIWTAWYSTKIKPQPLYNKPASEQCVSPSPVPLSSCFTQSQINRWKDRVKTCNTDKSIRPSLAKVSVCIVHEIWNTTQKIHLSLSNHIFNWSHEHKYHYCLASRGVMTLVR